MNDRSPRQAPWLPLLMLSLSCSPRPPTGAPDAPAAPQQPQQEASGMNEYVGLWRYAADPKGRVALDPLFGDSTLALTADGGVTMSMDGGGYVLEGRANTTSFTPDRAVLEVVYPGGRNNRLTLVPDRGPNGEVLGFLVLEAEAELATSYYTR